MSQTQNGQHLPKLVPPKRDGEYHVVFIPKYRREALNEEILARSLTNWLSRKNARSLLRLLTRACNYRSSGRGRIGSGAVLSERRDEEVVVKHGLRGNIGTRGTSDWPKMESLAGSAQRVRQIEVKALRSRHHPSRSWKLKAFWKADDYNGCAGPNEPRPVIHDDRPFCLRSHDF